MAVYKRRYNPYAGSLTPPWSRFFVLARFAIGDLLKSRFFVLFFMFCWVPILFFAGYIFIANNHTVEALLNFRGAQSVDNSFFARLLMSQGWFAFWMTCWVGPALVSGDLTSGALPLFLSRPFSRAEYVLGKLSVLFVLLSLITWVPALLLFSLESGLANGGWAWSHLWMIGPILFCSAIWILTLSLIALAISAWVKLRIVATAAIFVLFFIPSAFGHVFNAIMKSRWGNLLDIAYLFNFILIRWLRVFSGGPWEGIPIAAAWGMLLLICAIALLMLNARLRAREVVRG